MNPIINVQHLKKHYQQHKKEPGLRGSLKALFKRKYNTIKAVDDISFTVNQGEWGYAFHSDTLPLEDVEALSVAANDKYGNTSIAHLDLKSNRSIS